MVTSRCGAAASQERSYNSRQQKHEASQRSQRASLPPPTHFVGLRCTTPPVESAVSAVHARLLSRDANAFSHMLVSPATAHITLCVLSLLDDDTVRSAAAALQTVHARAPSPSLTGALDAFRGNDGVRVLYFDLARDAEREALARLHADVEAAMRRAGFFLPQQAFTPHLTVAKVSKVSSSRQAAGQARLRFGLPAPEELAAELPPPVPVPLTFSAMDLCMMRGPKEADGFYPVAYSVPFLAD